MSKTDNLKLLKEMLKDNLESFNRKELRSIIYSLISIIEVYNSSEGLKWKQSKI